MHDLSSSIFLKNLPFFEVSFLLTAVELSLSKKTQKPAVPILVFQLGLFGPLTFNGMIGVSALNLPFCFSTLFFLVVYVSALFFLAFLCIT